MAQKKHTPEQIIRKLREVEVAQGKGKTTPQAVKQIGAPPTVIASPLLARPRSMPSALKRSIT